MSKVILAIDPGASGGYALKHSDNVEIATGSLPEGDDEMLAFLRDIHGHGDECELVIEKVASFGGQNIAASMSKLFGGKRFIEGAAMALGFRVVNVAPQKWQAHFSLGKKKDCGTGADWKRKLKTEAARRNPGLKVTLENADALLILEWALANQSLI